MKKTFLTLALALGCTTTAHANVTSLLCSSQGSTFYMTDEAIFTMDRSKTNWSEDGYYHTGKGEIAKNATLDLLDLQTNEKVGSMRITNVSDFVSSNTDLKNCREKVNFMFRGVMVIKGVRSTYLMSCEKSVDLADCQARSN